METSIKAVISEIKKLESKRDRNNKRRAEIEKENSQIQINLKELYAIKEQFDKANLKTGEYFKKKNTHDPNTENSCVKL